VEPKNQLIYESTKEAVTRARAGLVIASVLIGLGFFYLYNWYGSWELSRAAARRGIATEVRRIDAAGYSIKGSIEKDQKYLEELDAEAEKLEGERADREFEVPFLRLKVSAPDFSVAILMVSATVLVWILFCQRRITFCLRELQRDGWEEPRKILQFTFVLMGNHATPGMQLAARCLPLGLPLLAAAFWASDVYDLYSKFWRHPIRKLAFKSVEFDLRVMARLSIGLALAVLVGYLGTKCYREFLSTEDELLRFDNKMYERPTFRWLLRKLLGTGRAHATRR
jgi:hypothetical protein